METNTQLAVERTRLALERTMMAWIRTSTALISFGFTIYKFFEFAAKAPGDRRHLITPRYFALVMIGIGLVALSLSAVDHRRQLQKLPCDSNTATVSTAGVVAALISIMGLLAFVAALLRA